MLQGLGSGALQEFLDSIDKQAEQVSPGRRFGGFHPLIGSARRQCLLWHRLPQIKLGLLAALGEQAAAQRDLDPALLSAIVSLAELAPAPGSPESYIADCARKYM